jgi:hypothetical protein
MSTGKESEPVTIGLGEDAHRKLQGLKESGYFAEMVDAYRFAVSLALAHGMSVPKLGPGRVTFLNVGSLDPDKSLYLAVSTLREETSEPVYRTTERLAEWGVEELDRLASAGQFSLTDLLQAASEL